MKKIFFISLLFLLFIFCYAANSQNDSAYNNFKIKINPIQTVFFNEYAINTEYTFAKQYGIDLKAGYIYSSNSLFNSELHPDKGLIVQIGLKKYHNILLRKKRKINQYTGLWFLNRDMYEYYSEDRYKYYYSSGTLKALIGSETFYKYFILDLYFGFGIRIRSFEHFDDYYGTQQELFPTLHLGISIGFNIPIKKTGH
jgi:hypothetical protein